MQDSVKKPFFWGAATSAHQVEGGNYNDWTEWEEMNAERLAREAVYTWPGKVKKFPEMRYPKNYISGKAADHYNRYKEDFDIAKSLGHNAHRFSIEWSRIEPEEGRFDEKEIQHYRDVVSALHERGIEPFVTLWHWTNPVWLRDLGGPENKEFPFYFVRFVKYVVGQLNDNVKFWMTLNEPTSVVANSYMRGVWPPQKKSPFASRTVAHNLAKAHVGAFRAIHDIDREANVGLGHIMVYAEPASKSPLDRFASLLRNYFSNEYFLKLVGDTHDFMALQYYFHLRMKFFQKVRNENKVQSDMDWEIYPEGLYYLLKRLAQYRKPIFVTENGLADAEDALRADFIGSHVYQVRRAMDEGVDVRGYFYWSLLDNFEWDKGFWPRFGLVGVDYNTMERRIRKSAFVYKEIIENTEFLN